MNGLSPKLTLFTKSLTHLRPNLRTLYFCFMQPLFFVRFRQFVEHTKRKYSSFTGQAVNSTMLEVIGSRSTIQLYFILLTVFLWVFNLKKPLGANFIKVLHGNIITICVLARRTFNFYEHFTVRALFISRISTYPRVFFLDINVHKNIGEAATRGTLSN